MAVTIHREVTAIHLSSTAPNTRVVKAVISIPVAVEEGIMVAVVDATDMVTLVALHTRDLQAEEALHF